MVELWLQFTILTAAIYAFISLLDKVVSDTVLPDPAAAMALNGLPRFLTFMIIGAVGGNLFLSSIDGLWTRRLVLWAGIGCGALYAIAMIVMYRGLAKAEVSRFVTLFATRTIFTTVLAFLFLGESFPWIVYVAIVLIVIGAMILSVDDPSNGLKEITVQSEEAIILGVLTAVMFSVIYTALGGLTVNTDIWSVLFWIGVGGTVVSLDFAVIKRAELLRLGARSQGALIANGGLSAIAFFAFTAAVATGPVSLVAAIINLDAVIVFIGAVGLSYLVPQKIQEQTDPVTLVQKGVAIVLIIGGGALIEIVT